MRLSQLVIRGAVLAAIVSPAATSGAAGYWNVPSNFCQCLGWGWGAGYHAPLVLGPIRCHGWCDPKEVRLPYPPAAACAPWGCGAYGCDCGQPSRLNAAIVAPAPAAPASTSANYLPRIER